MPPMTLDELSAVEAIRQTKARYCRFVDTKQWVRLEALFTADARLEGFGSVPDGASPAAFVAGISARLAGAVTIHHVHAPEIKLMGSAAARAIWPMMDYVDFAGAAASPAERGWIGWGFYEEDYVRADGEWRLAFMRLARQRMDPLAADHPLPNPGRLAPDATWL